MPTYQYQCRQCAHMEERFHGMTETPRVPCPQCGGLTERVITKPRTVLTSKPESEPVEAPAADAHDCGSGCALHRRFD